MSHFAFVLAGKGIGRWSASEVDLGLCESIDEVVDLLRDFDEPIRVLMLEQDDEYAVLVRLDASAEAADEPMRVFLSNGHAADDYRLAGLFAEDLSEIGGDPLDGDEDAPAGVHDAAPFGDAELLKDLGMDPGELIELAVHEGTLPIDLIDTVCERLGGSGEFEAIRG